MPNLFLDPTISDYAQEIINEAKWMEHYAHTPMEIDCVEDCIRNIENCVNAVKEIVAKLKNGD